MKTLALSILSLSVYFHCFSQSNDTINIKTVKVVESRIPEAYKVTTFDSSSIEQTDHLATLLQENSTVFIKDYGPSMLSSISFRGTGASHTNVLWNGLSLNSPMNGQIDFSLYPTLFVDDIELHHGASGLMDGSGALGGSVNLANKAIFNKGFSSYIQQSFGSFESYITSTKLSYSNKDWFTQTTLFLKNSKNNYTYTDITTSDNLSQQQYNAEINQYGLQQTVARKIKNSELGINLWYFNSERMLPPTLLVDTNYEQQADESFRGMLYWKGLKGNLQYQFISGFIKDQSIYDNKLADIYSISNSYTANGKLLTKYFFKNNFTLKNDISVRHENTRADGYSEEYTRFNNSWLLGVSKQIKRITISGYNRMMWVGENQELVSPSVAMYVSLLKKYNLKIKANYGINYNYPSFNDLYWTQGGNPNLEPEKAEMSEFGIAFSQNQFFIEATCFYSNVDNWIIWTPNSSGTWSPDNLKEVENKGVELNFKFTPTIQNIRFSLSSNYSLTYSTNLKAKSEFDNSVDKQLIYVPFHQVNYQVSAKLKNFILQYSYSYIGERFITTDNNWYLPAYFVSNFGVNKQLSLTKNYDLKLGFKINNIYNQAYQSYAYRPMPGRNYLFNIALLLH